MTVRMVAFASLLVAMVASCARAIDVSTCEEFAAVDRKTETEVTITEADFECGSYTRLSIRSDMVLKSTVGKITFNNLSLKVYGSLTVEPDVVFTGVTLVDNSGGALKLELGAVGVFQGTAEFNGNSIKSSVSEARTKYKGGAIHNKGSLTFEKDAAFVDNLNEGASIDGNREGAGDGGAISVHVKGSIHFMGNLVMSGNEGDNYIDDGGGDGGAIHNRGDIIVDGTAEFTDNNGGKGGAIYQDKWASIIFNDFVTFTSSRCFDTYGGTIANFGGDVTCEAGSLFFDGFAENSGDGGYGGAIYNGGGGVVTLKGSTTFRQNYGFYGGAIFNQAEANTWIDEMDAEYVVPTIVYPEDTVFEDNYGEYCNDVAYARDADTCGL